MSLVCYSYKRLSTAIEELNMEDDINVVFHPFELNPNMPEEGINTDNKKIYLNLNNIKSLLTIFSLLKP